MPPIVASPARSLGRRRLLAGAAAIVPLAYLTGCDSSVVLPGQLFTLGVASGEPSPHGVVLWTRLAPRPLADGGMPAAPVEVAWTVASDQAFTQVVQRGTATATPADAHSVHVEVTGLEPGRWYWYRFIANGEASPTGRTRTAPTAGAAVDRMRFGFASCQQYEQGFFAAHRDMAAAELDLVLFLGDYIYEVSWGRDLVRSHAAPQAFTLADYRNRYALYKTDRDLQTSHAAAPWVVTWDDHELSNDYANDLGERIAGVAFRARRVAAYKAFWEHMPLRPAQRPGGADLRLYRAIDFGDIARFAVLDDRQYRDHQVCHRPGMLGGANVVSDMECPERRKPHLTMLGQAQERWLDATLDRSPARWNVLAQQTLMAQFDREAGPERKFWTDGWDGYPAARRRLLDSLAARRPANPLVIGGDVHATLVADLKPEFDDLRSPVVATEICGTSISSQGPANAELQKRVAENPHVKYGNSASRGYIQVELTRDQAVAELRGVADVRQADSEVKTVARFVISAGKLGAEQA